VKIGSLVTVSPDCVCKHFVVSDPRRPDKPGNLLSGPKIKSDAVMLSLPDGDVRYHGSFTKLLCDGTLVFLETHWLRPA